MARNLRLFEWPWNKKKAGGWLALTAHPQGFAYAHATRGQGKPAIDTFGAEAGDKHGLDALAKKVGADRYRCSTMLQPGEYQLFLIDAPAVPTEEFASAVRWKVKDMIDYPVERATLDVLPVPNEDAAAARPRFLYAVVAANDVVRERMEQFGKARVPLSVIDIPETAQRNLAALFEESERSLGVLYLGDNWGLLTITFGGELYLSRRLDAGLSQLAHGSEESRQDALDRLSLELQRTYDHFGRQFRTLAAERLIVAPAPGAGDLAERLKGRLGLTVGDMDLSQVLEFSTAPDIQTQWRLFHHFGAALRQDRKAA